jgi:hypothetical protein
MTTNRTRSISVVLIEQVHDLLAIPRRQVASSDELPAVVRKLR